MAVEERSQLLVYMVQQWSNDPGDKTNSWLLDASSRKDSADLATIQLFVFKSQSEVMTCISAHSETVCPLFSLLSKTLGQSVRYLRYWARLFTFYSHAMFASMEHMHMNRNRINIDLDLDPNPMLHRSRFFTIFYTTY